MEDTPASKSGKRARTKHERDEAPKKSKAKDVKPAKAKAVDKGKGKPKSSDAFKGLKICLVGQNRAALQLMSTRIVEEGGEVVEIPDATTTHVVSTSVDAYEAGMVALRNKHQDVQVTCPVVKNDWVSDCLGQRTFVNIRKYKLLDKEPRDVYRGKETAEEDGMERDEPIVTSSVPSPTGSAPPRANRDNALGGNDTEPFSDYSSGADGYRSEGFRLLANASDPEDHESIPSSSAEPGRPKQRGESFAPRCVCVRACVIAWDLSLSASSWL
jgi:hypothetical protein